MALSLFNLPLSSSWCSFRIHVSLVSAWCWMLSMLSMGRGLSSLLSLENRARRSRNGTSVFESLGDGGWRVGVRWHAAVVAGQARGLYGVALAEGKSFPWESVKLCLCVCESCRSGGQTQASQKFPPGWMPWRAEGGLFRLLTSSRCATHLAREGSCRGTAWQRRAGWETLWPS